MDTQDYGRSPTPGTGTAMAQPGAADDRLILDPSRWDFVQEWEDGGSYELRIKVSQVGPGEFEVVEAEPVGEANPEPETAPEEEAKEEAPKEGKKMRHGNPAIARLMEEEEKS